MLELLTDCTKVLTKDSNMIVFTFFRHCLGLRLHPVPVSPLDPNTFPKLATTSPPDLSELTGISPSPGSGHCAPAALSACRTSLGPISKGSSPFLRFRQLLPPPNSFPLDPTRLRYLHTVSTPLLNN
ncbi:hypothetical protein PanWU01x14_053390 [Parasponia andersonii]|uniref:Uncharacterized protein n=1 Tax=Parasponia andersonii TaxID=3476 RepID=A0A2P5DLG1_PARAD|nr:hypothetical protein PanWU01x14_053390 [Parasponia andersonii]